VADSGSQAGAQTVALGEATLSQQEKNTRQMSTKKISITSFIGKEARYPSGRCTFEESETSYYQLHRHRGKLSLWAGDIPSKS
jgi:hypothetical protein